MSDFANLSDLLPFQENYYLLYNGQRYACHGISEDCTGLLVFTNLERAEQFTLSVSLRLPEYQPVKVTVDDFLEILKQHQGKLCIADRKGVTVASIESPIL